MDDYPLLNIFLTMMYFFLWVVWFFLLFKVITDVFRDHKMSGWGKAAWTIFVIALPFLGVFVYLIARGSSMRERDIEQAQRHEAAMRGYIREVAGTDTGAAGGSMAASGSAKIEQLEKLSKMKEKGELTQAEFELAKGQALQ